MAYLLLLCILKPLLVVLSLFRAKKGGFLVIATAQIGDYVNASVLFEALTTCDVLIDKDNIRLALHDKRINRMLCVDHYKTSLWKKLTLAAILFWRNYQHVYVVVPNNLNLFLGLMAHTNIHSFIHYKSGAIAKTLLYFYGTCLTHTRQNLTVDLYLHLINSQFSYAQFHYKTIEYDTLPILPASLMTNTAKVGVALSAGNKIKQIPTSEWLKIVSLLDRWPIEIHCFGLASEQSILDEIMQHISLKRATIVSQLGTLHLEALPYAIAQTKLFIASDTGGIYIADSCDVPTIVFAGPCEPKEQRPLYAPSLVVTSNAPCTPFSFVFDTAETKKCDGFFDTTPQQLEEIEYFMAEVLSPTQTLHQPEHVK